MKNKKIIKTILTSTTATFLMLPLINIASCSCNKRHSTCNNTNRQTFNISKYTFEMDKEYSNNDIQITLSGQDCDKLNISYINFNKNKMEVGITPKNKPSIATKYSFDLIISNKENWSEKYSNCELTFNFVDDEIKNHDENSWLHAIQHISKCKHPTIFIGTDASYYLQPAINLFFSASQLAKLENHTFDSSEEYKYNDMIFIVPNMAWDYKHDKIRTGVTNYNYLYNSMVKSEYGYTDIIANSKKASKDKVDVSLGNQMIISNLQDLDLSLEDYDPTLPSYEESNGFNFSYNFINKIMDMYEEKDPNIKFNFVVNDWPWRNLCNKHFNDDEAAKLQIRMFKKKDKIYLLSDGSGTWAGNNSENYAYKNYILEKGYSTAAEQAKSWNKITLSSQEEALNYYKTIDPMMFFNNDKYFYHFSTSTKTTFAPINLDDDILTTESTYKPSIAWFIPETYKIVLGSGSNYDNYLHSYLNFFNFYGEGHKQEFSDFIIYDTYKNFDSNKKNLIFFMPGAFRNPQGDAEALFAASRAILGKIKANYPEDKWNYLYSFHPRFQPDGIKKSLDNLLGTTWPSNTLVLDNHYPFEFLMLVDQYLASSSGSGIYHMIDPTSFDNEKPSGIMTGFDITSTCFYGAMSIFANEKNIGYDKTKKLIQPDAFFIPNKFSIPNDFIVDGKDYGQANKDMLLNYYASAMQIDEFTDLTKFKIME